MAALALASVGCDSNPATHSDSPPASTWRWDNPVPLAHTLYAVTGVSSGGVFAVGEFGAAVHYDGTRWNVLDSGTKSTLRDVWAGSKDNVYAVGDAGAVRRFDGTKWRAVSTPAGSRDLNAVWGMNSSPLVVVGDGGLVLTWDGQNWAETVLGFPDLFDHYAVWGNAPDTIYVVGQHATNATGSSYRYDGTIWIDNPTGRSQDLFGLFGVSGTQVVAAGANRTLLDFDGTSWSIRTSGTGLEELRGVWGTGMENLWLVGRGGGAGDGLFRWSSGALEPYGINAGVDFFAVWGDVVNGVYTVGHNGTILADRGAGWTAQSRGATHDLHAVHGSPEGNAIAVGNSPNALVRDGGGWFVKSTANAAGFTDVWAISDDEGFAVSTTGTVFYYVASAWTEQIASGVRAVWAQSATEAWAVGSSVRKLSGSAWLPFTPAPAVAGNLNDVWGNEDGDVFVAGENGVVLCWNGVSWTRLDSLTSAELYSLWGTSTGKLFVVGAGGAIIQYDSQGGVFSRPTSSDLHAIWAESSDFAVAAGRSGAVVSFDGADWTEAPRLTELCLYGVWGASTTDVFAVGERGVVLRYAPR